jgi:hypothetical protein
MADENIQIIRKMNTEEASGGAQIRPPAPQLPNSPVFRMAVNDSFGAFVHRGTNGKISVAKEDHVDSHEAHDGQLRRKADLDGRLIQKKIRILNQKLSYGDDIEEEKPVLVPAATPQQLQVQPKKVSELFGSPDFKVNAGSTQQTPGQQFNSADAFKNGVTGIFIPRSPSKTPLVKMTPSHIPYSTAATMSQATGDEIKLLADERLILENRALKQEIQSLKHLLREKEADRQVAHDKRDEISRAFEVRRRVIL